MRKAVIVSAARTAVGTFAGAFSTVSATDLGAIAVRETINRAGIESSQVDEVVLGNVLPGGLGLNPARVSQLAAGVPKEVSSYTINKACGSGLKAVALAAGAVCCGLRPWTGKHAITSTAAATKSRNDFNMKASSADVNKQASFDLSENL